MSVKKYKAYKDSGVEWIGEIPFDWEVIKLKWITPIKRGASPRPIDDLKYFDENGEFSWVRIADVSASDRYLEATKEKLSELGASLSVKQYPGDFFLSIAGSVGKPIITKIKCCIHDGFVWFPELEINPEFLYYIFQTGLPYSGLGKLGTQLNLNTETIGNIYIPNISAKDIESIVSFLDHKTGLIDEIIAKKERLIQVLQAKRQATINEVVTGKKVWNAASQTWEAPAKVKNSGVEWLGEIPEEWEVVKLKYLSEVVFSSVDRHEYDTEIPVSICHYTDAYKNDKIDENTQLSMGTCTDLELEKYQLKKGQVIITKDSESANDIGVPSYVTKTFENSVCGYHLAILTPDENNLLGEFLFRFLQTDKVKNHFETKSNGVTRFGLGKPAIENLFVINPPIESQNLITKYINENSALILGIISKLNTQIQSLKSYRQSLISEAVTGKIDVREWEEAKINV